MTRLPFPLLVLLAALGCRAPGPVALDAPPVRAGFAIPTTAPTTDRVYPAVVVRARDGDTVILRVSLGLDTERVIVVRLYAYDAAEKLLAGAEVVRVRTRGDDQDLYGRTLGVVELERKGKWISLADEMIRLGWTK
jgi:endonuclease YncB( thermonuclease family)